MPLSAIVVGAGVFGAALADRLAGDGWDVTLIERHEPGHARAASGGDSRLLRCAHGADVEHARSAARARELWLELGAETGAQLLAPAGLSWFARREDGWEADSERVLRAEGIDVQRLEPADAPFPSLAGDDLAFVLHEPDAGVLRARRAVLALVARAAARGARLRTGIARPRGAAVEVDDERLEADRVVWACGAWLSELFGDLLRLRVTRQEYFYFAAPPGWATPPVPGWVDYDGAFYGTGDLDGLGVKVAPDAEGPPIDPETGDREASAAGERVAREYLERRFPALAGAPLAGSRVCQYAATADSRFIVAPHPEHPSAWIVGGDSGHAFKHGPAIAERIAAQLRGDEPPDPRRGLAERAHDRSLRTAGGYARPL